MLRTAARYSKPLIESGQQVGKDTSMMGKSTRYLSALGSDWLTPLYDPLQRWVMRERHFKGMLVAQAGVQSGHRVLDLGCGTGTLTIMLKRSCPRAELVGVDGDPKILNIARRKASRAGVEITFDIGMAFDLPYPDRTFDRILSSLVVHHLSSHDKPRAMQEVLRVLRSGGELHLVDFGRPTTAYARLMARFMRRFEEVEDNLKGRLPGLMRAAGFEDVSAKAQLNTLFGTLEFLQAGKAP